MMPLMKNLYLISIIFVLISSLIIFVYFYFTRKKEKKTIDKLKIMIESITYRNNSMEFDLNSDDLDELKAGKIILESLLDSNLKVLHKNDLISMITKINTLIVKKERIAP